MLGLRDEDLHFSEEEGWELDRGAFMGGVESADFFHDHCSLGSGFRCSNQKDRKQ